MTNGTTTPNHSRSSVSRKRGVISRNDAIKLNVGMKKFISKTEKRMKTIKSTVTPASRVNRI